MGEEAFPEYSDGMFSHILCYIYKLKRKGKGEPGSEVIRVE